MALKEFPDHVLSFGAGHSHFEDEKPFTQIKNALADYPNVILLLPSPDVDRSLEVLRHRSLKLRGRDYSGEGRDYMEEWVRSSCNTELASFTVYTEGKTLEQTRDEILKLIA